MKGSVTILGTRFDPVLLNYDIFNQQILLNYIGDQQTLTIIVLNPSWIDDFQFAGMQFRPCPSGDSIDFCQILGEGNIKILYLWKKELKLEATIGTTGFIFTGALRESLLQINGLNMPYNTNRNLVRIFSPEQQKEVKNYLKSQRINVKKASDKEMTRFLTYLNQLK